MRPELERHGPSNPRSKIQLAQEEYAFPLRPTREMLYGRGHRQREGNRLVFLSFLHFFKAKIDTIDVKGIREFRQLRAMIGDLCFLQIPEQKGLLWCPNPLDIYFGKFIAFSFPRDWGHQRTAGTETLR